MKVSPKDSVSVSYCIHLSKMANLTNRSDSVDQAGYILTCLTGTIGALAALDNGFILAVFLYNKRLLSSSSLLFGLIMAHLLNGIFHFLISVYTPNFPLVRSFFCIKIFYPNVFFAIYQLLPILLALNGFERLLALVSPAWYRINCTNRRLWLVTGCAYMGAIVSMAVNGLIAWHRDVLVPPLCMPPHVLGESYTAFAIHMPAVVGGLCASACSAAGVHIGRRRIAKMPAASHNEIKRVKKQMKLAQCLLMICGIDILCVVVPNAIFFVYHWIGVTMDRNFVRSLLTIFVSDSIWNILAFVIFNAEFWKVCKRITKCGQNNVAPTSVGPATTARS